MRKETDEVEKDDNIFNKLRDLSYVPGKEKTWISRLPDHTLYEIFIRLKYGENSKAIAREIKCIVPELANSTIHSISQGILKFKDRIEHLLTLSEDFSSWKPIPINSKPKNDIENFEHIAKLQSERIQFLIEEERRNNIINVNISKEIESFTGLVKANAKLIEARMDEAKEKNSPQTFEEYVQATSDRATEMTNNMTEGDKARLLARGVEMLHFMLTFGDQVHRRGGDTRERVLKNFPALERFLFSPPRNIEGENRDVEAD